MKGMFVRVLLIIETLFWGSFWLQTRVNLREWWPSWFNAPLNSDYLIPFVYLSDLVLGLLLLVWLLEKMHQLYLVRNKVDVEMFKSVKLVSWLSSPGFWLGVLLLVVLVSVVANGGVWWSWYGWWRLVEGVGLSAYIYERWQQKRARKYGLGLLLAGLLFESMLLIGEWIAQKSLGLQWLGEWSFTVHTPGIAKVIFNGQELLRGYGTFAHPNIAAAGLLLGLIVLSWWGLGRYRGDTQHLPLALNFRLGQWWPDQLKSGWAGWRWSAAQLVLVLGGLLAVGLFVTFSRSVWLVGLACLGLLLVWSGVLKTRWRQWRSVAIWLVVGVSVCGMVFGPMVWSRFSSLDDTDRLSIERRIQLNDVALNLLEEHPWLGVGVNNFITHVAEFGPLYGVGIWREPVHNLYLLLAVEVGMIGFGFWILAHGLIWLRLEWLLRQGTSEPGLVLLIVLWLAVLLLGLTDHYWWTSQPGRLLWWLLVGGSMAVMQVERTQLKHKKVSKTNR